MKKMKLKLLSLLALSVLSLLFVTSLQAQKSARELGYYNGQELSFSADLGIPQKAPAKVRGNVYLVVYPINWFELGLNPPQCNPCDHLGDGITFDDFHDHVLDSIPGVPSFTALKNVSAVLPNYSFLRGGNDPVRDAAVAQAYAAHLPATSVDDVNDLLNSTAPDGTPLAVRNDLGIYIRLSVVGPPVRE
jgi:hypothetical protein